MKLAKALIYFPFITHQIWSTQIELDQKTESCALKRKYYLASLVLCAVVAECGAASVVWVGRVGGSPAWCLQSQSKWSINFAEAQVCGRKLNNGQTVMLKSTQTFWIALGV